MSSYVSLAELGEYIPIFLQKEEMLKKQIQEVRSVAADPNNGMDVEVYREHMGNLRQNMSQERRLLAQSLHRQLL